MFVKIITQKYVDLCLFLDVEVLKVKTYKISWEKQSDFLTVKSIHQASTYLWIEVIFLVDSEIP